MKCSIDNECPRAASHLKNKAKKNAIIEGKCAQIEAENRLLLEKMSHIMRVRLLLNGARRLTCVAYHLTHTNNHKKWEEEAKRNNDILQNICEFKPQPVRRNDQKDDDSMFGYMDFYESIPEQSGK